jgi:hypothetical protein
MNGRKLRQRVEDWEQHLVQAGEAHCGLELDARSTKDPRARFRRGVRSGMQELGLADPGLAGDEEHPTVRPYAS